MTSIAEKLMSIEQLDPNATILVYGRMVADISVENVPIFYTNPMDESSNNGEPVAMAADTANSKILFLCDNDNSHEFYELEFSDYTQGAVQNATNLNGQPTDGIIDVANGIAFYTSNNSNYFIDISDGSNVTELHNFDPSSAGGGDGFQVAADLSERVFFYSIQDGINDSKIEGVAAAADYTSLSYHNNIATLTASSSKMYESVGLCVDTTNKYVFYVDNDNLTYYIRDYTSFASAGTTSSVGSITFTTGTDGNDRRIFSAIADPTSDVVYAIDARNDDLLAIDYSSPASPALLSVLHINGGYENRCPIIADFANDRIYLSAGGSGSTTAQDPVNIINVSNPSSMSIAQTLDNNFGLRGAEPFKTMLLLDFSAMGS